MAGPAMTSRERVLAAIAHQPVDHTPLYAWCFGVQPAPELVWTRQGQLVPRWYTGRLEHIHTLPHPWDVEDDFRRAETWLALGVDDVIDLSVPWGTHPDVTWRDGYEQDAQGKVFVRTYVTPAGTLRHAVRSADEAVAPGWPVQPPWVPLFEDFNIPRAVRHAVTEEQDLAALRYLYTAPTPAQTAAYRDRVAVVRAFCNRTGVAAQAWAAFGLDAVIWLCGVENAVWLAAGEPDIFGALLDIIHDGDRARVALALEAGGIDLVVQRGWYSSTDFWSPDLFRRYLLPRVRDLVSRTHQAGKSFGYVMTTGVQVLADLLIEAGIDLLYFIDPVQDRVDLPAIQRKLGGRVALAGGVNAALTLGQGDARTIDEAVATACSVLGQASGFVLSPVDALFPDTPWSNVVQLIESWKRHRIVG